MLSALQAINDLTKVRIDLSNPTEMGLFNARVLFLMSKAGIESK